MILVKKKKKNNIVERSTIMRNTLHQTSKVGVKPTVYQGRQNQCPTHCAKSCISLWAAAAGLTGFQQTCGLYEDVKLLTGRTLGGGGSAEWHTSARWSAGNSNTRLSCLICIYGMWVKHPPTVCFSFIKKLFSVYAQDNFRDLNSKYHDAS